jgi:hypothetical protein
VQGHFRLREFGRRADCYGVAEDEKPPRPTDTDPGITDEKFTREWIEQVANSKIHPRISGIRTVKLANKRGGSIIVVTIPASQTGPHQAPDKRYYKRFELQSAPMEDYEIRDILNRVVTPELYVRPGFPNGIERRLTFSPRQEWSEGIPVSLSIGNRSKAPQNMPEYFWVSTRTFDLWGTPSRKLGCESCKVLTTKLSSQHGAF